MRQGHTALLPARRGWPPLTRGTNLIVPTDYMGLVQVRGPRRRIAEFSQMRMKIGSYHIEQMLGGRRPRKRIVMLTGLTEIAVP